MKNTIIILLLLIATTTKVQAQYEGFFKQGKEREKQQQYYKAIKSYTAANAFATTDEQKKEVQKRINFCANKLENLRTEAEQQRKLAEQAKIEAEKQKNLALQEKARSDSLLKVAEEMRQKVETAMFDKAVKERFTEWLGYNRYDWDYKSDENTKKGLEILQKVDSLDLSYNALLRLPKEVTECPNLKHINLLGNPDIDWNDVFTKLKGTQVNSIYVSVNDLSDIDSNYHDMITGIEILRNGLTEIPENILRQKQLEYLDLSGEWENSNYITLRTELIEFTNLKYLNLEYCSIDSLPHEIGNLTNLIYLDLKYNYLTVLPPEIGNLTNLTELDLSWNKLTTLPTEIDKLTNLTNLYLGANKLDSLPSEIENLINLTYLDLSNNQLSYLSPEIGNLSNLTKLDLRDNQLTSLPPEIQHLASLTYLDLWGNDSLSLVSISNSFSNFKKPIELAINVYTGNPDSSILIITSKQTSLPPEIGKLTNLTKLYIDWKKLKTIPKEILNLNCFSGNDWYYMAQIFAKNQEYENAVLVWQKAIEKEANNYSNYFNLSWYSLFVNKPKQAINAAKKTLELEPRATGVYSNLALGYVLNNEFDKAKPVYLEWKDKQLPGQDRTFKEAFLQDIADLEAAGIKHKDFKKVRELLK